MGKKNTEERDKIDRWRSGEFATWLSIVGNIILFAFKFGVGLFAHSMAILADAFHSLSDVGTSVVALVGFKVSRKAPDRRHPFGHGRAEYLATFLIAVLLIVSGIELGRHAIGKLMHPESIKVTFGVMVFIVITIVVKEFMARYVIKVGHDISSMTLEADAWHHRTDALSSALVLVSLILTKLGFGFMDPIVGIAMAVFIIWLGIRYAESATDTLMGTAPSPEFIKKVKSIVNSYNDVINVHNIIVHSYGIRKVISLDIEISNSMSLIDAHNLADEIDKRLMEETDSYVVVHIDPIALDDGKVTEVIGYLNKIIDNYAEVRAIHDTRINGDPTDNSLVFELELVDEVSEERQAEIKAELIEKLKGNYPGLKEVVINIEPDFAY